MDTWEEKQQYEEDGEWDGRRDRLNEILSSDDDEDDVEHAYRTFYKDDVDGLKDLDDGIVEKFEEKIKRHLYTDGKFGKVDKDYFLTDYMVIPDVDFKAGIGKPLTSSTSSATAEAAALEREAKYEAFIKHIEDGTTKTKKLNIVDKKNYAKDSKNNHYIRTDIKSKENLLTSLEQTPKSVPDGGADGNAFLDFLKQAKREAGETIKAEELKRIAEEEAKKATEEKKHQEQMKDVLNNMSNQLDLNLKEFNSTLTTPVETGKEAAQLKIIQAPSNTDPEIKKAAEQIQRQSEFNKVLFNFLRNIADLRKRHTNNSKDDGLKVIYDILLEIRILIQTLPKENDLSEIFNVYQTEQEVINDSIAFVTELLQNDIEKILTENAKEIESLKTKIAELQLVPSGGDLKAQSQIDTEARKALEQKLLDQTTASEASKQVLEAKVAELEALLDTQTTASEASKQALEAEVAKLQGLLDAQTTASEASKQVLEAKVAELQALLGAQTTASEATKQALEAKVAELEGRLVSETNTCNTKTSQLENEIKTKMKEIEDLTAEIKNLSDKDAEAKTELENKLNQLTQDLGLAKNQLNLEKEKNASNQQSLDSILNDKIKQTEAELDTKKKNIADLTRDLEMQKQATSQQIEAITKSKEELEATIQTITKTKGELETRIQDLEASVKELSQNKTECVGWKSGLETSQKQIVELTQSLEVTKIDLEKQRKLNEESKQECNISTSAISAEKDSIAGKLSEDTTKLLSLQIENQRLQDQLKSLESSIQTLTKNSTECETTKTGLQSQLTALQSQLEKLEKEKQVEHTAMEDLKGVENQEKEKLGLLENENINLKNQLQELTAMKESSATNLTRLEQELADTRNKANEVETLKGTMQKEREQLNKARDEAIEKLEASYAKVIQLEKDKSTGEGEKNEAITKMNEAIEELNSARQNAESKCSQTETEKINTLTEEIRSLGEKEKEHLQDAKNCEQKHQDELIMKQELEKAVAQAKDDLNAKDAEVTNVQNQVVALNEEMKKKDELISQIQVSTENVKKELETAKALDVNRVAFEKENKKLLADIETERQEKKQLQADKEQMVAQLQGELVKEKEEQARKDQEAKDKADREAKEKAEQALIQEANEKADREAKERAGQALIQEAKEKEAKERADQARSIQEEKEKTDREARIKEEQEAKLKSDKEEKEKAKEKEVIDVEKAKENAKLKEQEKFPIGSRRNAYKINLATNITSFGINEKDGVGETDDDIIDVPIRELKLALHRVKEAFNICKTDLLIKYVTLMSYPKFFLEYIRRLDKTMEEVKKYDAFFVRKVAYPSVIDHDSVKKFRNRDSFIYSKISESKSSDVIFVYQLIKELDNNTIDTYINDDKKTLDMIALINDVIMKPDSNLKQITRIYKDLKGNPGGLNTTYNELIANKKRISTFIKYRRDTDNPNPRYNIEISKNNLLMLEYTNVDDKVGFKSGTEYNRESAVTYLKNKTKETYLFGEFDGIYTSEKPYQIANSKQVTYLVDRLVKEENDLCMIGYGQSGSGKTSTLIYLSLGQIDGILIELCKLEKFRDTVSKITVKFKNIYTYHWLDRKNYNDYKDFEYNLDLPIGEESSFTYDEDKEEATKSNWRNDKKIALSKFINDSFDNRQVESTPNNPNSSRSHVICCLKCDRKDYIIDEITGKETTDLKKPRTIIICDLAGVENKFQLNSMDEVINFDLRYSESDKYDVKGKDINFDKYFCEQENKRDLEDGGNSDSDSDSDSTVSSYSSSSSSVSSVSSVSSYSSSSSSDYEEDDGTHYESQDTYKSDWMLYRNLLDEEEDGKLLGDTEYGLGGYLYGKYNNESESKMKDLISDIEIKDKLFIEKTEKPEASGHCMPRYSFDTVCKRKLQWKEGWKGETIKQTITNLEKAFEKQIPIVRYHRNLYKMYEKFLKLEISGKATPEEKAQFKEPTAFAYLHPKDSRILDKYNSIDANHDNKNTVSILDYISHSELTPPPREKIIKEEREKFKTQLVTLYLVCQVEIWNKVREETAKASQKISIGSNTQSFHKQLESIVTTPGQLLDGVVKSMAKARWTVKATETDAEYTLNILEFLESKYDSAKREFEEIFCTKHRFNKLLFNMQLRINEGMMINHSLGKLREDIKSIMMNSISINDGDKTYLPIMYDNPISPAIRNTYIEDEYYDNFVSSSTVAKPINGMIMKIIGGDEKKGGLGLNIDNMYMAVFTVINITDSDEKLINNPPNPPYINISKLIYNLPLEQRGMSAKVDVEKILETYKILLDKTGNFSFYQKNPDYLALSKNYTNLKGADYVTIYEANVKKYIDLIQGNNPSTLIGSLEGTEMIKNTTFDKMIAYFDEDLNKSIFEKYKSPVDDIGLEYYNYDSSKLQLKEMDSRAIMSTLKK